MIHSTIETLRHALDSKQISARELTEHILERIDETEPQLHSFITITREEALRAADQAQREIDAGNQEALTGIPFALKDNFCTRGIRTTAGSNILKDYLPPYTATAAERLSDAILLGKTNLDEFAMGSSTEHSAFGNTANPFDLERVPGGSSGGSAASVASGQAPFALGSDTAGSVRLPAAFCNVVGFKPTYGRIPRYGVIAMASSLDTVATFTRSVKDAALLLNHMAGPDGFDATASTAPVRDYKAALQETPKLRIGIPREYMEQEGLDPEMKQRVEAAAAVLQEQGHEVMEVSLPHTKYALAVYHVLSPGEVSSNMARYDGIQFGTAADNAASLSDAIIQARESGFGAEVKRRIIFGTFALSSDSFDAYYKKAQQVRTLIRRDFDTAFDTVDTLLTPTCLGPAFKFGDNMENPLQMYLADVFTNPATLAGLPAISVPTTPINGLPVGIQLIAPQFEEARLLSVAHQFQEAHSFDAPQLVV